VTNRNAIADITVFCPGARTFMIETKQPGKRMRALQQYRSQEIEAKVQVKTFQVESLEQIKQIIQDGKHLPL